MFPKSNRISLPSDFYKIKKFGKRFSNSYFSIVCLKDESLSNSIFSVIVSKTVAKKANIRNKLKRISRALAIKNRQSLPNNLKCIIFPKPLITSIKNSDLEVEFLKLFDQINK